MTIHPEEQRLTALIYDARRRCRDLVEGKVEFEDVGEYDRLHAQMLQWERELAMLRFEQAAIPIDWPDSVKWSNASRVQGFFGGAELPVVFFYDCLLFSYKLAERRFEDQVVAVTIQGACAMKIGGPSDSVIEGHPLFGRGLEIYGAFKVENSTWKSEIDEMHMVDYYYDPKEIGRLNHFMWLFHKAQVEVLAMGYEIEVHDGTLETVVPKVLGG